MGYKDYLSLLVERIPEYVYGGVVVVFVLGIVLILSFVGYRRGWRYVVKLSLMEYLFLIYCSTVLFRNSKETSLYKPISFDNYKEIFEGGSVHVAPEMFFNVLFFVPLGMLLCGASKCLKWWHVMLAGCGISISIEVLQYVFRRGTMEVVDVFLNTLGCLIGIMIVAILKGIWHFCSYLFVPQWGRKRGKMSDI